MRWDNVLIENCKNNSDDCGLIGGECSAYLRQWNRELKMKNLKEIRDDSEHEMKLLVGEVVRASGGTKKQIDEAVKEGEILFNFVREDMKNITTVDEIKCE